MKRVLYFSRDYTVHDHRFLVALAESEYKIYFLRLEQYQHPPERRPLPSKIEPVFWSPNGTNLQPPEITNIASELERVISRVQPDLIHAGPIQRSAYLVALTGFKPLVSMSWGYDLIFDAQRNTEWERITRYTLSRSSVMVGDCDTVRDLAMTYGMPGERIITFPWGVDLKHFSPASSKRDRSSFIILSNRAWEPIYGVDVIARAFSLAAQERPDLRLRLLGTGNQADLITNILANADVLHQVDFFTRVDQIELPNIYRSADLYVSASHSDGTSISLLEALACGCPALVSDIPGNREWIEPGVQGWLFPDGDHEALAQMMIRAVEQRQVLSVMGERARITAEQRGDWRSNFPRLLEAYHMALDSI